MPPEPIAIQNTGLVTSIGLSTAATCAALRASVTNPTATRFIGDDGEWILAHQVPLDEPSTTYTHKLVQMASLAILECLEFVPTEARQHIPLLLCVAERERPGRLDGLDGRIVTDLQAALGLEFHPQHSGLVPMGRPGALLALAQARRLIYEHGVPRVLVAGTDTLLVAQTLLTYGNQARLLAEGNPNGFIPGEAAGAALVGRPEGRSRELLCLGVGHGIEPAPLRSGDPLRADGLTAAIARALQEANCEMHDLDFRVTDLSGEQYFFKEASLALARSMRKPKEEFDLWHPADCIGESGAAVGLAMIATALIACTKGYAKGSRILLHASADGDSRVAGILSWTGAGR